jgi:hypothetical protein
MAVSTSSATPPGEDAGHHVNGRNSTTTLDLYTRRTDDAERTLRALDHGG